MKKRRGQTYALYLPERDVEQVRLIASDQECSVSQVVARAIKRYLADPTRVELDKALAEVA